MLRGLTLFLAALVLWHANPAKADEPAALALGPAAQCVSWGANRLDCFSRGRASNFVHRWREGERWSGWENLGGATGGIGSCTSWEAGRLDCFVVGTDRGLWHRWYAGDGRITPWQPGSNAPFTGGWESLGGAISGLPSCVSARADSIDCFARGDGDVLVSKSWDGRNWGSWRTHGGLLLRSDPVCLVVDDGSSDVTRSAIYCVAKGPDSGLWLVRRTVADSHEARWESLGGVVTSQPSCVARTILDFNCFVRGSDNALHRVQLENLNRPYWESWGGVLVADPSCVSTTRTRIDCFVLGTDNAIFQISATKRESRAVDRLIRDARRGPADALSSWTSLGGSASSAPSCYAERRILNRDGTGRIDCFALGPDSRLAALTILPTGPGRWRTFDDVLAPRHVRGR